jgi:hypothetical protein
VSNEIVDEHAIDLEMSEEASDEEFKKFVDNLDIDTFKKMLRDEPREEDEEDRD